MQIYELSGLSACLNRQSSLTFHTTRKCGPVIYVKYLKEPRVHELPKEKGKRERVRKNDDVKKSKRTNGKEKERETETGYRYPGQTTGAATRASEYFFHVYLSIAR